ncbi:MAG: Nif3-like dinuclear metal center hexameric protein [Bacteroidota bacterium]
MTLRTLTDYLESIAPLHLQEHYDNSGLIVGDPDMSLSGIMISLDATESVIQDAIDNNCNVVLSHHPIVFKGIKRFSADSYVHRAVMMAIRHDIALYAIHTNLDNVLHNGVNERIAQQLGLHHLKVLKPLDTNPTIGAGCIGILNRPLEANEFLDHLKTSMELQIVKHTSLLNRRVHKVAICGGAGSFLLSTALERHADAFVTSDFKYHEYFDADGRIVICDIGHYESERFTIDLLIELLRHKFPTFALHFTKVNTNPVRYY